MVHYFRGRHNTGGGLCLFINDNYSVFGHEYDIVVFKKHPIDQPSDRAVVRQPGDEKPGAVYFVY